MTTLDSASKPAGLPAALRVAPALFAATLFGSALLLFAVQPMFTKMILPRLGGSPSVWSVAMVFFQGALLVGYVYAHLLATRLTTARGALVHLAVLAAAAAMLPIGVAAGFGAAPQAGVALWLVALFAASIGLPFAALSASAPLLQAWFARSGHAQAANPYVLYAASNLGSFAALIAYPFAVEPFLPLRDQALWWSLGFAFLAVLIAICGTVVARTSCVAPAQTAGVETSISMRGRLVWVALAAVPAGLVIAVTAYMTTDVASAPFLWVIPLALYLLTFVAVFRDRPWVGHEIAVRLAPFVLAPLAISVLGGHKVYWAATLALNLVGFLVLALVCHGELYRHRPASQHLTEFYLWTSLGGVVGGAFAGLLAPNALNNVYEYPILIAAAALALPGTFADGMRAFLRGAAPLLVLATALALPPLLFGVSLPFDWQIAAQVGLVVLAAAMLLLRHRPARFFGLIVIAFIVAELWQPGVKRVQTVRSFFGVHQVIETRDGAHRVLLHGTTIHGAERMREADGTPTAGRPEPLSYYYFGGPISEAIISQRAARGRLDRVAAVGLGTGSLACHKRSNEAWTFFEIDLEVARIARDPGLFRFLSACAPDVRIVLGDARLTLAASPERYDLIVLDAFSSDAIPAHLLTREAFAGYLSRLSERAVVVAHISNRHMELAQLVGAVAHAERLVTWVKEDTAANRFIEDFKANAVVAVIARNAADLGDLPNRAGWRRVEPDPSVHPWTDDYSDLLSAILRKKRE
jgi:predicted O-methyltransferase YrrM